MTLVVDASVAVKWFIEEAGRTQAIQLLDVADRQAPDLLLVEVANVVWKKTLQGQVGATQARFICASIAHCFDVLHSSDSLIERAIVMAIDPPPSGLRLSLPCVRRTRGDTAGHGRSPADCGRPGGPRCLARGGHRRFRVRRLSLSPKDRRQGALCFGARPPKSHWQGHTSCSTPPTGAGPSGDSRRSPRGRWRSRRCARP